MRKEIEGTRITLYGNRKNVEKMEEAVNKIKDRLTGNESEDRLLLQREVIDSARCNMLYDGNGVYSRKKILNGFKNIKKNGIEAMSNELYEFFHLCCGTICHYDIHGWISRYPTIESIRDLFRKNEYGSSVYDDVPDWKTDVKLIIKDVEKLLGV